MEYNLHIRRRAILIGCPGSRTNYLEGVKSDLNNMKRYLLSEKGGSWFENEITILHNPTEYQVSSTIQSNIGDYCLVYFSGHGWTDGDTQRRMIVLTDSSIADTILLNASPRQLVIVDACRDVIARGLSGVIEFDSGLSRFTDSLTREMFDRHVFLSPEGKIIVHSTQEGESSADSPIGGYFTNALLSISTRMRAEEYYTPVPIVEIIKRVPNMLQKHNNRQIPSIYLSGDLRVPFAFATARIKDKPANVQHRLITKQSPTTEFSNAGWALLGLSLLVLGGLAIANSN